MRQVMFSTQRFLSAAPSVTHLPAPVQPFNGLQLLQEYPTAPTGGSPHGSHWLLFREEAWTLDTLREMSNNPINAFSSGMH